MRKKILLFLFHPLCLSFVATFIIILLFLPRFPRYLLKQDDLKFRAGETSVIYDDLDGNDYSDRIWTSEYANENVVVALLVNFSPSVFFQEWDFNGTFDFSGNNFLMTGDFDNDRFKEIYILILSHDSVFLCSVSDLFNKNPVYDKRFITTFLPWDDKPNIDVYVCDLHDMNRDGYKDLVFSINAGFSGYPRNAYIYDIHQDTLLISPQNGYPYLNLQIADITGDSIDEILITGYASQNVKDTIQYTIHDLCCWAIVLDNELQYLFPPVKFPDYGYSGLDQMCLPNGKGFYDLYTIYHPPLLSGKPSMLNHFSKDGEILRSCSIPDIRWDNAAGEFRVNKGKHSIITLSTKDGHLFFFDTAFQKIGEELNRNSSLFLIDSLDVDADGNSELIFLDQQRSIITIYRSDMTHPVAIQTGLREWGSLNCSLKLEPNCLPQLSVFSNNYEFLFTYQSNPMFYTRWLIYAGIFLAIYLFTLLIRKIQRIQIEKRQQTEKKITELQLKIVRNQMDPHFSMNAINSVIAAIQQDKKETASQSLLHFSKMYRSLVLSGDKIKRSLAEEIDFSRNYLELEKFRFKERFDYQIEIDPAVNLNLEVPKMIIQSPVENAVKHGLLTKESGGMIVIRAFVRDHQVILEVEDNGIGRGEAQKVGSPGTGKGLKIMEEFLDLYHKITGVRIQWQVIDLHAESGSASGTKVVITIPGEKS